MGVGIVVVSIEIVIVLAFDAWMEDVVACTRLVVDEFWG
jgi:hypothetical protein